MNKLLIPLMIASILIIVFSIIFYFVGTGYKSSCSCLVSSDLNQYGSDTPDGTMPSVVNLNDPFILDQETDLIIPNETSITLDKVYINNPNNYKISCNQ